MSRSVVADTRIAEERAAAGMATVEELAARSAIETAHLRDIESGHLLPTKEELERIHAALGGIPITRLYGHDMLQLMGVDTYAPHIPTAGGVMEMVGIGQKLFIARDEVTWLRRREVPGSPVDVFLSMSCGTQRTPHLLLDTVAVAQALGVSFVAVAGPAGCCGKPYLGKGQVVAGEAFSQGKIRYAQKIGATTTVTWCHACQQTATIAAARREILDGTRHPVRELGIHTFLAERVRELGDQVPWKHRVNRRVLVEGHTRSPVHRGARLANAALLSLIPGVEVVGLYDGHADKVSPCSDAASLTMGKRMRSHRTPAERQLALADMVTARGADTVSCGHFQCHRHWGRYASHRMSVRHAVSILAEALGCAHPDRAQAASRLADAAAVVAQTRPIWESWGICEAEALEIAKSTQAERGSEVAPLECGCGGHGNCPDGFVPVDVLAGTAPGLAAAVDPPHQPARSDGR